MNRLVRTPLPVWALVLACAGLFTAFSPGAAAQELVPRAYSIAPVGSNAVVLGYSRLQGSIQFNGALPITGVTAAADVAAVGYYRAFALFDRTANVAVSLPYAFGQFAGTVLGTPRSRETSGFMDSSLRLSVNLFGGKAMAPLEFVHWRQDILVGASIKIVAPSGQYDSTRLFNWSTNRWAFKPELGYSQRLGSWTVDAYLGGWFFTTNPKFFSQNPYFPGTQSLSQAPIGAFEAHLSYDISRGFWVSADANYWRGGATSLNGVPNSASTQTSSRVGFTASVPLTAHQLIKLSASEGAYVRYGGNYRSLSLVWQYSWLDRSGAHR